MQPQLRIKMDVASCFAIPGTGPEGDPLPSERVRDDAENSDEALSVWMAALCIAQGFPVAFFQSMCRTTITTMKQFDTSLNVGGIQIKSLYNTHLKKTHMALKVVGYSLIKTYLFKHIRTKFER